MTSFRDINNFLVVDVLWQLSHCMLLCVVASLRFCSSLDYIGLHWFALVALVCIGLHWSHWFGISLPFALHWFALVALVCALVGPGTGPGLHWFGPGSRPRPALVSAWDQQNSNVHIPRTKQKLFCWVYAHCYFADEGDETNCKKQ